MHQETVEAGISAGANKLTVVGSAGAVVGGIAQSDIGMWSGIFIGLAGLAVNWYFKRKSDRRNQAAYEAYMSKLKTSEPSHFKSEDSAG